MPSSPSECWTALWTMTFGSLIRSGGASNGISYASRQRGRSRFSNIDLLKKYNYIGLRHFLRGRGYIDLNFLFYVYPDLYYPLDYDTYFKSKDRFVMVTSNCLTGKAEYFEEKKDKKRLVDICKASCTLPILCPITYVDGIPMVDGGGLSPTASPRTSSSLPVTKAIGKKRKIFTFPALFITNTRRSGNSCDYDTGGTTRSWIT